MDVGFFFEFIKQILGAVMGLLQISTESGRGVLKIVDFFGMLTGMFLEVVTRLYNWVASLFAGA